FSINFYLGDRVVPFEDFAPEAGYLILGEREYDGFMENYGTKYEIEEVYDAHHKSCDDRDWIHVYRFKKK
ncbi:MAG: dolichyl-phosphate-mannose--protein mannosyltransferase, partial [Bacteroidales bacterium]|nr:dolichyl-phosphate-mannose--protein mannosyltransferase [Bacteroidales bacterium]